MPILADIWRDRCNVALPHDQDVQVVLDSLTAAYDALECRTFLMPAATQQRLENALTLLLLHYRALNNWALRK